MDISNTHPTESVDDDSGLQPFVRLLRVDVAGDVIEIVDGTWALHGVIPVDGNVLLAEFDSYDDARHALDAFTVDTSLQPPRPVQPDPVGPLFQARR